MCVAILHCVVCAAILCCIVCAVILTLCVLCAAILLGIEFQIEIQQTRNYCQPASPQEISRQHIMFRLFDFSCPRTVVGTMKI